MTQSTSSAHPREGLSSLSQSFCFVPDVSLNHRSKISETEKTFWKKNSAASLKFKQTLACFSVG